MYGIRPCIQFDSDFEFYSSSLSRHIKAEPGLAWCTLNRKLEWRVKPPPNLKSLATLLQGAMVKYRCFTCTSGPHPAEVRWPSRGRNCLNCGPSVCQSPRTLVSQPRLDVRHAPRDIKQTTRVQAIDAQGDHVVHPSLSGFAVRWHDFDVLHFNRSTILNDIVDVSFNLFAQSPHILWCVRLVSCRRLFTNGRRRSR